MLFAGCFNEEYDESSVGEMSSDAATSSDDRDNSDTDQSDNDSWAVYWYLCGSDLESENGAATADLMEMLEVELPENVSVVIQTGGASSWDNDTVSPNVIGRYLYDVNGFQQIDEQPQANMGEAQTLADFLSFCESNFPAEHKVMIFWNHGGGSVSGAAFDENYDNDSLTLDEMYSAFSLVYDLIDGETPFEVVGFDTCLMATIDTAYAFSDIAKYLVASEELEPGCGWNYTGWLQALADNTSVGGAELGKAICDTFYETCVENEVADEVTLSVTDLSKFPALLAAYDNLGKESLALACENPRFLSKLGREAARAENYGGNNDDEGYTNMVDLGHLVRNATNLLPESSADLLEALDDCIVYRISGEYRSEATGLSCYYSYNGDEDDLSGYYTVGASEAFKHLYTYAVYGSLPDDGLEYLENIGLGRPEDIADNYYTELDNHPLTVSEIGDAVLNIGGEYAELLKSIYFTFCYLDSDSDTLFMLGTDNDIYSDWENGVFTDNFRGVWGGIDGNICYMELVGNGDGYNLYSVPILLNGSEYNLRVSYDYAEGTYTILGARKGLDDSGMADKNLRKLMPGDEISLIQYAMSISDAESEIEPVITATFIVSGDTAFQETDLGDGTFAMMFEMVDISNNSYSSDVAFFTVEGGVISTEA